MRAENQAMLTKTEQAVYRLRSLFGSFGYTPYKMSKFEAYDLYLRNKSFLVSEHIMTFTDHSGKLMALKPDVTLSIVKSAQDDGVSVQKVYYNEHVYRVPKGDDSFKEIMQMGIECVGHIDGYNVSEVMCLAAMSLAEFSEDYVLDVSHLGILSAFLDKLGADHHTRKAILACVGEKNTHGIREICNTEGLDQTTAEALCRLVTLYGDSDSILPQLNALVKEHGCGQDAYADLCARVSDVKAVLPAARLHIDFSVVNSMSYYNGIVFRGFVPGAHTRVLSGGQYDLLVARMGKQGGAVGFAVYLDQLEALDESRPDYDVDTLLVAGNTPSAVLLRVVNAYVAKGERVLAVKAVPENITAKQTLYLDEEGEVTNADQE